MQYRTSKTINDNESISLAIKKINANFNSYKVEIISKNDKYVSDNSIVSKIASNYNIRSDYPDQIWNLYEYLKEKHYPKNNLCENISEKIT